MGEVLFIVDRKCKLIQVPILLTPDGYAHVNQVDVLSPICGKVQQKEYKVNVQ